MEGLQIGDFEADTPLAHSPSSWGRDSTRFNPSERQIGATVK